MVKFKKVKVCCSEIEDVICNKCGNSMMPEHNVCGLNAEVTGCYESSVFSDMDKYKFSICEHCLLEIFETFKVPVEFEHYYFDNSDCWEIDSDMEDCNDVK